MKLYIVLTNSTYAIVISKHPPLLRQYANLESVMNQAIEHYVQDVKSGDFPNQMEQY